MRIRQCPRCDCRFADEWELEDHLQVDHGVKRSEHVSDASRENPAPH